MNARYKLIFAWIAVFGIHVCALFGIAVLCGFVCYWSTLLSTQL